MILWYKEEMKKLLSFLVNIFLWEHFSGQKFIRQQVQKLTLYVITGFEKLWVICVNWAVVDQERWRDDYYGIWIYWYTNIAPKVYLLIKIIV